jgi:hypothetical protein
VPVCPAEISGWLNGGRSSEEGYANNDAGNPTGSGGADRGHQFAEQAKLY